MTYTDAFIKHVTRFDYMDNPYKKEYTPWFLDSIEDLEEEMASLECIIEFPSPVFIQEEEDLIYA